MTPSQQALIDRLVAYAAEDDRVLAILLYGSHAAGTADVYSDIDIGIVTTDLGFDALVANRDEIVRAAGEALLVADFGDPSNLHVILADGTALELIIDRESELILVGPHRPLLDKATVADRAAARRRGVPKPVDPADVRRRVHDFWHDVEHLVTALGRGETWWAYGQLDELRRQLLDLARLEANVPPEGEAYWKADRTLPADRLAALASTVAPLEAGPIRDAALALLDLYRELASALARRDGVDYPTELARVVTDRLQQT